MMKFVILLLSLAIAVFGQNGVTVGYCVMRGTSNDPGITGTVTFTQSVGSSLITMDVNIQGITQNINLNHGMHVHEFGDLSSATATSAGSHWNPTGATHGCEYNSTRHYGDTGNWFVSDQGTIIGNKTLDLLALTGNTSIIGLAVVLHNTTDDCSVTTSAGSRLAYCVIGVANPTYYDNATSNTAVNGNTGSYQRAICMLTNTVNSNITGWILFSQSSPTSPTTVQAVFYNMTGIHGFHIHQYGDLRLNNGLSTGSHWNPRSAIHGIPPFPVRHSGDMGNIYYYDTGVAYYAYVNDAFTIPQILGLAAIVHANQDDCSAPVGNAGSRLAYCVIGVANPATNFTFPGNVPTDQNDTACQTLYATSGSSSSAAATTGSSGSGVATTGGSGSGVATTGASGSGVATTGASGSGVATTGSASGATGGATSTTDADSSSSAYGLFVSMLFVALAFF